MTAAPSTCKETLNGPSAKSLIRTFERRYFLVLAAVACLVVLDQAAVQPLLVQMNAYAPAINLAGRQRMLSQRLAKAALKWQSTDNSPAREAQRQELDATRRQWAAAHFAFESGDRELSLATLDVPEITSTWRELQPHFEAMNATAVSILADHSGEPNLPGELERQSPSIAGIIDHEAAYLSAMDRVVKLLELDAAHQIFLLRISALGIAAAVLVLLVALGRLVVRPATNVIRGQVDELESRVAERTSELADANASLEREMIEHAQAEEKTQLLATQLAHASRVSSMGHLTTGLSHELNQPLAAIVNYAETCALLLAQKENGGEKLRQHIEQIKEASARAGKILHRMRDFVRPTAGTFVEVDLNALINEVVELCKFEADRAKIQVSLELTPAAVRVVADAIQIQQVLVNLLQNAIHAVKSCDVPKRQIIIRTAGDSSEINVEVVDTGLGLDAVDEMALFSPFYTTKPDGLGLGLAISRTIVERHQGQMYARNSSQGGAIIGFALPIVTLTTAALGPEQRSSGYSMAEAKSC